MAVHVIVTQTHENNRMLIEQNRLLHDLLMILSPLLLPPISIDKNLVWKCM